RRANRVPCWRSRPTLRAAGRMSRELDEEASPLGVKGLGERTAVSVAPASVRSSTDHESQYLVSAHKGLCPAVTFRRRSALVPRDSCSSHFLDLAAICRRLSLLAAS